MARPPKYSEDDLLIAVHEYAKCHPGKISISKLAEWASENIPALYGVKYADFQRLPRSGNAIKNGQKKACLLLIKEINQTRMSFNPKRFNVLLNSSDVCEFFNLPQSKQIDDILKSRQYVESLLKKNQTLSQEQRILQEENCTIKKKYMEISHRLEELQKELEQVKSIYSMLEATIDEHRRRKVLANIGVEEGFLDPTKAFESMSLRLEEINGMFSFEPTSVSNSRELRKLDTDSDNNESLRSKIISGINFGEKT